MIIGLTLSALVLVPLLSLAVTAHGAETLKVGDPAPRFEAKDQDGKNWKLADSVGKQLVVLYFYPKDNTPGCTKEACGFRDGMEDLKKNQVQVFGVSFDSAESHQKFISKFQLNFPLLVDTDGKIADAYGARKSPDKDSAKRISFLIGLDGKIAHITDGAPAEVHVSEMQETIAAIKKK